MQAQYATMGYVAMAMDVFQCVLHHFTALLTTANSLCPIQPPCCKALPCIARFCNPANFRTAGLKISTSPRAQDTVVLESFDSFFMLWLIQVLVMWKRCRYGFPWMQCISRSSMLWECQAFFGSAALPLALGLSKRSITLWWQGWNHVKTSK